MSTIEQRGEITVKRLQELVEIQHVVDSDGTVSHDFKIVIDRARNLVNFSAIAVNDSRYVRLSFTMGAPNRKHPQLTLTFDDPRVV